MKIMLNLCSLVKLALCGPAATYVSNSERPAISTENSAQRLSFPSKVIFSNSKFSVWIGISRILDIVYLSSTYPGMCEIVSLFPPL